MRKMNLITPKENGNESPTATTTTENNKTSNLATATAKTTATTDGSLEKT